jgi:hypothetical protein
MAPKPDTTPPEEGHPIGAFIGAGVETTWVGEHEYVVDESGRITRRA